MPLAVSLLGPAARLALPKVRELIKLGPDDIAENKAIVKAAGAVALELLDKSQDVIADEETLHLTEVFVEALGRTDTVDLQRIGNPTSPRADLIEAFRAALEPLDDRDVGFHAMDLHTSASEVAVKFVNALTENLFTWGEESSLLRDVGLLLQIDGVRRALPSIAASEPPPPVVRAWITVATHPPEILVFNEGVSPIFEVTPTPTLIARDLDGQRRAMIGAGALTSARAAQIAPEEGYCWPLPHMESWSASPLVFSHLQLDFSDNAGRNWRLAHDQLTRL
ncbi:hypothetical protein [Geodermatophilus sp. CPCC 205506]|uniref:hypothetical protein n=1 Tax=Geodermatophilus sp. CPCC 205506 TaxID=2936596 RepID=UPI003EEF2952